MKAKLLIVSLAVAALPVAAHASIASEQAMQVNHGSVQTGSQEREQNLPTSQTRQDFTSHNKLGYSDAMLQALLSTNAELSHTSFSQEDQRTAPQAGHRQDW
ncbi:hypothetical protein GCM10027040_33360 [Halomonas shantousis]